MDPRGAPSGERTRQESSHTGDTYAAAKLDFSPHNDEELVEESGLVLDFDEIARKGSMTREEVAIAKWYGIYHSRQAGTHMARVVIPGGRFTSVQARALAGIAAKYAPNRLSVTTRQSASFTG